AIDSIPASAPEEMLDDLERQFEDFGGDRPIIALALTWCRDNLPDPGPQCLVHGDFRMGNLMVANGRVSGVLDWELAHFGDYHEDLAWGCVGPWRFGNYDHPAFGLASLDRYFASYEAAGGAPIDRERFRYWLIHRTIWWALGCLQMGAVWRDHIDRSLERAAIARRTIENEIDLLLLLEQEMPDAKTTRIALSPSDDNAPHGETSAAELVTAVGEWIAAEVKPRAEGRNRFLAAVAINALNIAARDMDDPPPVHDRPLCDAIRAGETGLTTPGLLDDLRRKALRKGANDAPKYAGLKTAMEKWT
ncbi:MAG: phosphotransferase, partial [Pontixanthobacter sp.]